MVVELERTFLVKSLPDFTGITGVDIKDYYIPTSAKHAYLRLRKTGDTHEITQKKQMNNDPRQHSEQTISLSAEEFQALIQAPHHCIHKTRYHYKIGNVVAEFDVFHGKHQGLAMVDVECASLEDLESFSLPDFCLCDVSDLEIIA